LPFTPREAVLLLVIRPVEDLRGLEALVPAVAGHRLDALDKRLQLRLGHRLEGAALAMSCLSTSIESMPTTRLAIGWLRE